MLSWIRIFRRQRDEMELDEELKAHLAMEVQQRVERGESLEEASAAAKRDLGNADLIKDATRRAWGGGGLESLLRDIQYSVRLLCRNPGFSLAAVLIVALAVGANAAMFSLSHAALLRPLPYDDPDRIVMIREVTPDGFPAGASAAVYWDLLDAPEVFENVAACGMFPANLTGDFEPEQLLTGSCTASLFPLLGTRMQAGRAFLPEDELPGAAAPAILSHGLWQRKFGGDPSILGSTIWLYERPYTVSGIAGEKDPPPDAAPKGRTIG